MKYLLIVDKTELWFQNTLTKNNLQASSLGELTIIDVYEKLLHVENDVWQTIECKLDINNTKK